MHKCFKKVRIGRRKTSDYEKLYGEWVEIRNKTDNESKLKSKELEETLADKYADNIFDKIKEEIDGMTCDEGAINSGKLWKLKKKLHKNYQNPPTQLYAATVLPCRTVGQIPVQVSSILQWRATAQQRNILLV